MGYLRFILVLFEVMLGLKVNFSKSALVPISEVSIEVPELARLACFFVYNVDYLPSFRGLPVGAT